jgi:hypothetical protein
VFGLVIKLFFELRFSSRPTPFYVEPRLLDLFSLLKFIEPVAVTAKCVFPDGLPYLAHEMTIIVKIMDRIQSVSQDLFRHKEMSQVASGKMGARVTPAIFINGSFIINVPGVLDCKPAIDCEKGAVAGIAGRHDTIKHIDTTHNRFYQILW